MPFGYLVSTVIVTLCTFFVVVAPRRPRPLASLSFRFGVALNELPFLGLYWIAGWTLVAVAQGNVSSAGGRVVLALAVLTAAGLLLVVWRGLRARPRLEEALDEGLGTHWRADLDGGLAARLRRRRPPARVLLLPFPGRGRDVERVADIRYGDAGRHVLDVYCHRSRPQGAPVLVYWHGGGFYSGGKNREARPLLHRLASQGWVCVSANYRLMPQARFPDQLVDAKKAIAWVRENGHAYGADVSTLFVAGSSAGAHLACTAALTPGDPRFQPGFEEADTSVTAAIGLYGYYGRAAAHGDRPPSSPADYLRSDAPPVLLVHGDRDTLVPVEAARAFAQAFRDMSSAPVVYAELPGAQHAFDLFHSLRFEAVVDAAEAFTAWVRTTRTGPHAGAQEV